MKLNDVFPSKYVKAADLDGREPTVVIRGAAIEKLGDDSKLVVYFQGKEKGLVCNRTNADRIAFMYGDDTDLWIGKEITLFTDMVSFQGKTGPAIRVKAPSRRDPPRAEPPRPPDSPRTAAPNGVDYVDRKRDGYTLVESVPRVAPAPAGRVRDDMDDPIPF